MIDLNKVKIPFTAVVTKNDPLDDRVGFPMENRWIEGDTIEVVKVEMTMLGTFLHNIKGQDLNIKRAGLVEETVNT